jgi:periplasmic divalent cation tolerance protein
MATYCLVYITAGSEAEAEKIGDTLVCERLAACANRHPIKSTFWWEGKVDRDDEVALVVKTKSSLVDEVVTRVKELHSYQVPCIVALPIVAGNPDFLNWIGGSTK